MFLRSPSGKTIRCFPFMFSYCRRTWTDLWIIIIWSTVIVNHPLNVSWREIDPLYLFTFGLEGPPPPYLQNYIYPTATSHPSFNNNGTIYFAPRPPPSPNPFPPFPPSRTFENSSFHQFHPLPPYPSANLFQNPHFPSGNMHHYPEEAHSMGPNRPFKSTSDRESHKPDYRSIANSYSRSATTAPATVTNQRHQRNQPTSLPLSAYMNTEQNDHSWNNNGSYQKRRSTRTSQHQFPLSSYDPRQYGFQRRGTQRRTTNNNRSNDVDLIEEWWEDESTELIGTKPVTANDDSGHSSLSTSTNTIQDTSLELSSSKLNDSTQSSSDTSTTDSKSILSRRLINTKFHAI